MNEERLLNIIWLFGPPVLLCLPIVALIIHQLWKDRHLRAAYRRENLTENEKIEQLEAEIHALINDRNDQ